MHALYPHARAHDGLGKTPTRNKKRSCIEKLRTKEINDVAKPPKKIASIFIRLIAAAIYANAAPVCSDLAALIGPLFLYRDVFVHQQSQIAMM